MKLTFIEHLPDGTRRERVFEKSRILVGRAASECNVVYETSEFPNVSRRHAEISIDGSTVTVADCGSSYGTFLNGKKILQKSHLNPGDAVGFGPNGPEFILKSVETSESIEVESAIRRPNVAVTPGVKVPNDFALPTILVIGDTRRAPLKLEKDSIWMGRDRNCELLFDPNITMVSRRHAEISKNGDDFVIRDNNTFNGTLVNSQRISAPTPLYHNDEIELGRGGPKIKFICPGRSAPFGAEMPVQRSVSVGQLANFAVSSPNLGSKTMAFSASDMIADRTRADEPQLVMSLAFGDKTSFTVGRASSCEIQIDGLQISNRHARLTRDGSGIFVEDLGSTNGIYVNSEKVAKKKLAANDVVLIGSFEIRLDADGNIGVFDTRAKARIDVVNLTKTVKSGGKTLKLLNSVSFSVKPNEFIGLLGASGAGKSTLIDAMNGMRRADSGSVRVNNLDLYENLNALKHSIGYVPQEDIIHRELSVYKTLYYVAKLRLSRDVTRKEIDQIISEVFDVTGLSERRNVKVSQLSGGQRKRVSIAVELITKPSVIYLDEPTSGLDPSAETKIMRLFKQIAASGRTVILTTHAMENVRLFDKVVLMMRGRIVFYGTPEQALQFTGAGSFKELYEKLETPESRAEGVDKLEAAASEWQKRFESTPEFNSNVRVPLSDIDAGNNKKSKGRARLGIFGSIRQTFTLSKRYLSILAANKLNLAVLLLQAPIIAAMMYLVIGDDRPRDFAYFILSLVAIWFGTSISAREIVREQNVYRRERMVNLGIFPYAASKFIILGAIVALQCFLLFLPLKFMDLMRLFVLPGQLFGFPHLWIILLTAAVGVAIGLFVSAIVKTSETATSLVPLILIPQLLFSGLIGIPTGLNKVVGLTMPSSWSFDAMKRFSTLDALEQDGALPNGKTKGLGVYKNVEESNKKLVADFRSKMEDFQTDLENRLLSYEADLRAGKSVPRPEMPEVPKIADPESVPTNLSAYISFLHPWMNEIVNQCVLIVMFLFFACAVLVVLYMRDVN